MAQKISIPGRSLVNAINWICVCFVIFVRNCPLLVGWTDESSLSDPSDEDLKPFLAKQWENSWSIQLTCKMSLGTGSVITFSGSGVWGGEAGGSRCESDSSESSHGWGHQQKHCGRSPWVRTSTKVTLVLVNLRSSAVHLPVMWSPF